MLDNKENNIYSKKDFDYFMDNYNTDFSFLKDKETTSTKGYVPTKKTNGKIEAIGKSGITIATGFDLGQRNVYDLKKLGLPDTLINKLIPALGLKNCDALDYLQNNSNIEITYEETIILDQAVLRDSINTIEKEYNVSPFNRKKVRFSNLPPDVRTVILSVAYQYGASLKKSTPRFWKFVTSQDWNRAIDELNDFHDDYPTRREKEGRYLRKWWKMHNRDNSQDA